MKKKVQDINQWSRVQTWLLSVIKNCSYWMWIVMIQSRKWKENINELQIYYKYIFQIHPNSNPESRQKGLTRWQTNPEKNWGPKARAKRQNQENDGSNQGKRAKRRKVHCNYACTGRCCVTATFRWFYFVIWRKLFKFFICGTYVFHFRTQKLKNLIKKRIQTLHKSITVNILVI